MTLVASQSRHLTVSILRELSANLDADNSPVERVCRARLVDYNGRVVDSGCAFATYAEARAWAQGISSALALFGQAVKVNDYTLPWMLEVCVHDDPADLESPGSWGVRSTHATEGEAKAAMRALAEEQPGIGLHVGPTPQEQQATWVHAEGAEA